MYKVSSPTITQKQIKEAQLLSSKLKDVHTRKRAYIDFLGALYVADCFSESGLRANIQRSIFQCPKLYLDYEITDIYCNSHMLYVVTTYGTETVKIPLKHKQYDILPEAYIVVDVKIGMAEAEIKGVIYPVDLLTAQNDGKYYNININKLKLHEDLFEKIKKYAGIKSSIGKHLDCMNLFVPYVDGKITDDEKKQLIEHILTCETCKKRLIETIEFDNKSKTVENYGMVLSKEDLSTKDNFIKKINKGTGETSTRLQGAIDVIYEGKQFENLQETSMSFRPDIPSKTKKLILIAFATVISLLIVVIFAMNIPMNSKDVPEVDRAVEGTLYANNEEETNSAGNDFEVNVPKISKTGYLTVSKVSWEVSEDVKSEEQKKFLQTAGKSIRLNLQNDLLLSSEAAVNNKVKFDLKFLRDGNIESITVSETSGSRAVDDIIKQSIENTMYYMRPPKGAFQGKKSALTLVVNF